MPFKPGQSGNPGGRPKENNKLRELARAHTELAIATLAEICANFKEKGAARIAAAQALLDRGYGKPPQEIVQYTAPVSDYDLSKLSPEELREWARMAQKAAKDLGNPFTDPTSEN